MLIQFESAPVIATAMGLALLVTVPMTLATPVRSVPPALVRVAKASGASPLQIIRTAQLSEAVPSIIGGITINTIAMIEYSAIAGTIGAGGIGYVAVTYGYQRFDHTVMLATIVILVATVALVQLTGDRLVKLTTPHIRTARSRRTVTSTAP